MLRQVFHLLLSVSAAIAGGVLAFAYPMAQPLALIVFAGVAVLAFISPWCWLLVLPAALPVIGFAPWTGWITFEEIDLVILAIAAGGYAHRAVFGAREKSQPASKALVILAALSAASLVISMLRGFSDAGGFDFGWYQGYDGAMNSVRIAKSFFLAWLLVPLLMHLHRLDAARLARLFGLGMAIGLGLSALATVWERLAFTGLMNFSADYRSTALFWEMHVGGAALDGWLVLTTPFVVWAVKNARSTARALPVFLLVALAAYANLTTFSRGVYLALIVALPLLAWLLHRRDVAAGASHAGKWGPKRWIVSAAVLATLAFLVFPGSGYRGLLALLGLIAVAVSTPQPLRANSWSINVVSSVSGLLLGAALAALAGLAPKGPYVLYAVLFGLSIAALHRPALIAAAGPTPSPRAVLGVSALGVAAINVAWHWGGTGAALGMGAALGVIVVLLSWAALAAKPLWPEDLRWQGSLVSVGVAVCGVVAIFSGGAYMSERFSTATTDAQQRLAHWRNGIDMLRTPADLAFGKGLGRFPANYFFSIPGAAFPGTYKLVREDGNNFVKVTAGNHSISFGDLFRVSQRLDRSARGPFTVDLRIRTKRDLTLHAEVCEKHLLYVDRCAFRNVPVKALDGEWQKLSIKLQGPSLHGGFVFAPRLKMFSFGLENRAGVADIDDLTLTEAGGRNILANANFEDDMRRWFFSSDRDHLPWHAKNLQLNALFDQGIFGLIVSALLVVVALWRLNVGRGREDALSPYITASIVGFLLVGLFDSLTDVPRIAFIYYLLLLYAIALPARIRVGARRAVRKSNSRPFSPTNRDTDN